MATKKKTTPKTKTPRPPVVEPTITTTAPEDHWLTRSGNGDSPAPFRTAAKESLTATWSDGRVAPPLSRHQLADRIVDAAQYAMRAVTLNGTATTFDPDALIDALVVGLLGYWTDTGRRDP